MHAHNRTLIAKLGFADPDRKEPLHDAACRYLTTGDRAMRVMRAAFPDAEKPVAIEQHDRTTRIGQWSETNMSTALEMAISKGTTDYKTTIGFLDAKIEASTNITRRHEHQTFAQRKASAEYVATLVSTLGEFAPSQEDLEPVKPLDTDGTTTEEKMLPYRYRALIEVKIGPTSFSEVLRQINIYAEYIPPTGLDAWILAAAFDVSESYVAALAKENIRVIRLGQAFRDWAAAEQANAVTAKLEEI